MASITYDGRSFMLDGRRIWLVSGSVQYTQVPSDQWADRIHAAKLAGLNTIETSVVWSRHEPRPGHFDFKGDADLRRFVELVGKAGLYCVLSVGPFVDGGLDMGGLPAWLRETPGVELRTANQPFLEASSRFLTAVAEQVRDLQVTAPGAGGPIVLIQKEFGWTCGHDDLASGYLGELARYLREAGLHVPVLNNNNLWQEREGEIDTWSGGDELLAVLRQLGDVSPESPKIVLHLATRGSPLWGHESEGASPARLQRRIAECLAGGGQFNLVPFLGASPLGFGGGRAGESREDYFATGAEQGAPLGEAGGPGASFHFTRRICTFASSFARVFANLDPSYRPVIADPEALPESGSSRSKGSPALSVVHAQGSQGGVAFVFGPEPGAGALTGSGGSTRLLLPDGSTVPVELGTQSVAWCLFDVHLGGRQRLDVCTLNAFYASGSLLVCYGPEGGRGVVSVNGSSIDVEVPTGKDATVLRLEGMTVVVCNEAQIDTCFVWQDVCYLGAVGVKADGSPVLPAGGRSCEMIRANGERETVEGSTRPAARSGKRPLGPWTSAAASDYVDGSSPRYAAIDGPKDLTALGSPYGYGWYRVTLKAAAAKKHKLLMPEGGDRLHMFVSGEACGVFGSGPGAMDPLVLSLKKGQQHVVALADNLGRFSSGHMLTERKGLAGHLWETAAVKTGKMTIAQGAPLSLLDAVRPLWEVRVGDVTHPDRPTWSFMHRRKTPIIVRFGAMPARGLVVLNDQVIGYVDASGPRCLLLDSESLSRGKNVVQLALLQEHHADAEGAHERAVEAIGSSTSFYEGVNAITDKGEWAFAKWEAPPASAFEPTGKGAKVTGLPTWHRTTFTARSESPFFLDLTGLTKGQVYLNGQHVGRYFVAKPDGTPIPPQRSLLLPTSWLRSGTNEENELLLFDEHGASPSKTCLIQDGSAAPFTAQ